MVSHNKRRTKLSPEEVEKKRQIAIARKIAIEESKAKELLRQSAVFRKTPGKLLWWFSLSVSIFCVIFLADGFLEKKYTEFEIKSSTEDIVHVSKAGWMVAATFNWAFLDDEEKLGVHMYKGEFNKANESGIIELGRSPMFKVPTEIRIKNSNGEYYVKALQVEYSYLFVLPIFLFLISTAWIFVKPHTDFQWVIFGYFNMAVTPIAILFLLLRVFEYLNGIGMYEIDFHGLELPH